MLHTSCSIIIATILLLCFVDPQILYLLMQAARNESQVDITVDEHGQVKRRHEATHQWASPSASRAADPADVLTLAGQLEAWAKR